MNANDDLRPAAERLTGLIRDQQVILFEGNSEDKEYPYIKLSIWGAIPTNELFIKLSNGAREFVAATPSLLEYPFMADRRFGIDVLDHKVAIQLAEQTWELHKHELIIPAKK
jgi:hypothetical protein